MPLAKLGTPANVFTITVPLPLLHFFQRKAVQRIALRKLNTFRVQTRGSV